MPSLSEQQAALRHAYLGGGLGAAVSGVVWLIGGVAALRLGIPTGYTVLFLAGLLIFPLSTVLEKLLFRRAPVPPGNFGGPLVMETLPGMLGFMVLAFLLMDSHPEWAFPLAAIGVGTHYFPFKTAYGHRGYWVVGAVVTALGFAAILHGVPSAGVFPFTIGIAEILFGAWMLWTQRRGSETL